MADFVSNRRGLHRTKPQPGRSTLRESFFLGNRVSVVIRCCWETAGLGFVPYRDRSGAVFPVECPHRVHLTLSNIPVSVPKVLDRSGCSRRSRTGIVLR